MNCEAFRTAIVGDDPVEHAAAERHAAGCPDCAALLRDDAELAATVELWKQSAPAPSDELEARIARAIAADPGLVGRPLGRVAWWAAAAASLVLAGWFGAQLLPVRRPSPMSVEAAMRAADLAREQYVRSIAELERRAAPVLDRAGDPELGASQAALLLRYRDRLNYLDSVIAEVQQFLDENPGHGGGHAVLLAAYQEKQQVLGKLLQLEIGGRS